MHFRHTHIAPHARYEATGETPRIRSWRKNISNEIKRCEENFPHRNVDSRFIDGKNGQLPF